MDARMDAMLANMKSENSPFICMWLEIYQNHHHIIVKTRRSRFRQCG